MFLQVCKFKNVIDSNSIGGFFSRAHGFDQRWRRKTWSSVLISVSLSQWIPVMLVIVSYRSVSIRVELCVWCLVASIHSREALSALSDWGHVTAYTNATLTGEELRVEILHHHHRNSVMDHIYTHCCPQTLFAVSHIVCLFLIQYYHLFALHSETCDFILIPSELHSQLIWNS